MVACIKNDENVAKQIEKQKSGKKGKKNVGGSLRTQLASLEPDPAPREVEVMEGSRKPCT